MVFLRLEVKVFPREQAPSSPGLLRSLIGNNGDRAREEASGPKKYVSFLLAVDKPKEVTLGDLACMILDEWRILRPDQEPLAIKKLLDDANPFVDLNVGLTVEDVFVDRGKARADGRDQRATVRVIQKPTAHCPQRFPSVVQDWDSAVQASKRRRLKTKKEEITKRFSPIAEEDGDLEDTLMRDSPVEQRDVPVSSVETHDTTTNGEPEPTSDAIAGTPPFGGHGSEELGSPNPPARTERPPSQSRKRKQSPEEEAPVKNPRLEENTTPTHTTSAQELTRRSPQQSKVQTPEPAAETAPVSTPSPLRNKNRIPSFASPHGRRSSISGKPADAQKQGLGLGITKSPSTKRTVMRDMPSSQPSLGPPLFPSSAPTVSTPSGQNQGPTIKTSQSLQSAMRKNTPLNNSHQRRSVSFANGDDIAQKIPDSQSTPLGSVPAEAPRGTPTDSGTPSSSQIHYPAHIPAEKIKEIRARIEQQEQEKIRARIGQHEQEIEAVQVKLNDPNTDPRCLPPLKQLAELLAEIKSRDGEKNKKDSRKLRDLRKKLPGLRKKIQTIEKEALDKEKERPPSTEPPLPPSASKIDRSIPVTTLNGSTGLDAAPTWSFGPTPKANATRKPSVASSNGSHEPARSQPSQQDAAKSSQAKAPSSASKSPAPASKRFSESPVKTDTQASPSVVKRTPPPQASKETSTNGRPSKSLAQKPEVIEVASTDDEGDEDGESSDEDQDEDEDEDEDEDGEESEGLGETAEKEPAPKKDAQNLVAEPTKGPTKSLIDDEAQEASEEEEEEESSDDGDEEESAENEESSDEESSDEGEGSDESSGEGKAGANGVNKPEVNSKGPETELDLPPVPSQQRTTTMSPAQPSQPPTSQQTPAAKATLKGLLKFQRAEAAARQKQQQPAAAPPPEKEKRDVYDVPSSESEYESDSGSSVSDNGNSDQGDILPNGDSGKLRKPWSLRK